MFVGDRKHYFPLACYTIDFQVGSLSAHELNPDLNKNRLQLDRKIHCSLYTRQHGHRRPLSPGCSVWTFPCTNCLRLPSPSAQFVSCLFHRCSLSDVIPPHLPNYLRLPVSAFSQLPFQACHPPPPLTNPALHPVAHSKNKLFTHELNPL